MTPEKILSLVAMYAAGLIITDTPKVRFEPSRTFKSASQKELLAHAHYLCDGTKEFAGDPARFDKANRHLTAIQMCLSFAGIYTLEELMEHNRSDNV